MSRYSYVESKTAHGVTHVFSGPGIDGYIHPLQTMNEWTTDHYVAERDARNIVRMLNERDARNIVRMLNEAFEAGRRDKAREIRDVLGVGS